MKKPKISVHENIHCDRCEFKTFNMNNLDTHKKKFHADERNQLQIGKDRQETNSFAYDQCKFKADTKHEMNKHVNPHHGQPDARGCEKCKYNRNKEIHMDKHMISNQGQPKSEGCEQCNFKTDTKRDMDKHIASNHGQPTRGCDKCQKQFGQQNNLQTHRRQHHTCSVLASESRDY